MISKYLTNLIVLTFITQIIYTLNQETVINGTDCPNGYEKFKGILLDDQINKFQDFEKCIDQNFLKDGRFQTIIKILEELKDEVKNNNMNYCFLEIENLYAKLAVKSFSISAKSKCLDESIFQNCDANLICPPNHQIIYINQNIYPCVPNENIDPNHKALKKKIYINQCLNKPNFTKLDILNYLSTYYCINNKQINLKPCSLFKSCSNADCYYIDSLGKELCVPLEYQNFENTPNSLRPVVKVFLKHIFGMMGTVFGLFTNGYTMNEKKKMKRNNSKLVDSDFELLNIEKEQIFKEIKVMGRQKIVQDCLNGSKIYYIRFEDADGIFCIDYAYASDTESLLKKKIYGVDYNIKNIQEYFRNNKNKGEFKPFTLEEAQAYYDKKNKKIV